MLFGVGVLCRILYLIIGYLYTCKLLTDSLPRLGKRELIYLRIKSLFFNLHDVMKTVGGAKIPCASCRILATTTVFITS